MNGDGSKGRGEQPRPGLFQSLPEAVVTLGIWFGALIPLGFLFGVYGHIIYKVFKLGWDLIG